MENDTHNKIIKASAFWLPL